MAIPKAEHRAGDWRRVLEGHGFIQGDVITTPPGRRLHLFFGPLDVAVKPERPFRFDETVIEAHDIHFSGDMTFLLWQDITSVSVR